MELINRKRISFVDRFIEKYSDKLSKYVDMTTVFLDGASIPEDFNIDPDTPCFVMKPNYKENRAQIIVNEDICKKFPFTDNELHALLAHEFGHLFYKAFSCTQDIEKEFLADEMACQFGLKEQMISALSRMKASEFYDKNTNEWFLQRINRLKLPDDVRARENNIIARKFTDM